MKRNAAIIVAAGNSTRMRSEVPKQFMTVQGKPMIAHSFEAFLKHPDIDKTIVVVGHGQEELARKSLDGADAAIFVQGGETRRESVAAGLDALAKMDNVGNVLIHDAARPALAADVITRLIDALENHAAAVPVLPIVDSLARGESFMVEAVKREKLWRVQTPQAFHFEVIAKAHNNWNSKNEATDDARMVSAMGIEVALIDGDEALAKYTFSTDLNMHGDGATLMTRTGTGFDVHRLVEGEELWLCGVEIEHSHGLSGHSDADVAIHALVDAILGALALGDIGDHFPPSDPHWSGASSDQFLTHAMKLARESGYALSNADVTIICEAPRIGPHKLVMREKLAEIMDVQLLQISVKATTTERLGITGRREGIAAQATASFTKTGELI